MTGRIRFNGLLGSPPLRKTQCRQLDGSDERWRYQSFVSIGYPTGMLGIVRDEGLKVSQSCRQGGRLPTPIAPKSETQRVQSLDFLPLLNVVCTWGFEGASHFKETPSTLGARMVRAFQQTQLE